MIIDFQTDPSRYRHWKIEVDGATATLWMDVDENGGLVMDIESNDRWCNIPVHRIQCLLYIHAPQCLATVAKIYRFSGASGCAGGCPRLGTSC